MNNPSNATVKSFALGHKLAATTLDGAQAAGSMIKASTSETTEVVGGFFSGMKFAIAERRGPAKQLDDTKSDDAKLAEAKDLWERAHGAKLDIVDENSRIPRDIVKVASKAEGRRRVANAR